jgi:hypothetical protein
MSGNPQGSSSHAERLRRAAEESARADQDHRARERNAGVAIAVLAVLVVLILIALVSGATDVFRP